MPVHGRFVDRLHSGHQRLLSIGQRLGVERCEEVDGHSDRADARDHEDRLEEAFHAGVEIVSVSQGEDAGREECHRRK